MTTTIVSVVVASKENEVVPEVKGPSASTVPPWGSWTLVAWIWT